MHSLSIFGAKTNHEQIRTHKIHHGPDLGEATTFPLIVYSMLLHEAHIQMAFCFEIAKVETPMTLGLHNFVWRPRIEMRSEEKL